MTDEEAMTDEEFMYGSYRRRGYDPFDPDDAPMIRTWGDFVVTLCMLAVVLALFGADLLYRHFFG